MSHIDNILHVARGFLGTRLIAEAALAELALLRADRAKLDWLERTGATTGIAATGLWATWSASGMTIRAAIDAAMQKEALSQPKQNP